MGNYELRGKCRAWRLRSVGPWFRRRSKLGSRRRQRIL